jgi:hypothetical protein
MEARTGFLNQQFYDVAVTQHNLAKMREFCDWPCKVGDVIPINVNVPRELYGS